MFDFEKLNSDIELYAYVKEHESLNPKLWKNSELKPEIKEELKKIAKEFVKGLKLLIPTLRVEDVYIVGSNAAYNYTKYSDIDLHIIYSVEKFAQYKDEYLEAIFDYKNNFNNEHDYKIEGYKVELYAEYIEDISNVSNGIYSFKEGWITTPKHIEVKLDKSSIESLYDEYTDKCESLVESAGSLNKEQFVKDIDSFLKDFALLRSQALKTHGEYAPMNIVYKEFRNKGLLQQLRDLKAKNEKELENDQEQEDTSSPNMFIRREEFIKMHTDSEKDIKYKNFTIRHFPVKWQLADKEFENDGWIILSEASLGKDLFLPLYCEDEEGKNLNFSSLEEAKNWIDKYGDNYTIEIKNRDEIHAIPNVVKETEVKDSKKYWVNCELRQKEAEKLKEYLRDCGIPFEPSQDGEFVHFEMLISEGQEKPLSIVVNNLLK